jgi:hypothetical protein
MDKKGRGNLNESGDCVPSSGDCQGVDVELLDGLPLVLASSGGGDCTVDLLQLFHGAHAHRLDKAQQLDGYLDLTLFVYMS